MADKISYKDKEALSMLDEVDEIYKVTARNMNEIKKVVNKNSDILDKDNKDLKELNNKASNYFSKTEYLEQEYEEQIKNLSQQEPQLPEIVNARQGFETLGENIKKKIYFYDNVSEMKKASNLKQGDVVRTLGYYEANDGGAGEYRIILGVEEDGYFTHKLNNGFIADLIIENNTVNIKQIGARPQDKLNNKYDIKEYINAYISKLDKSPYRIKLYIPSGIWYSSGVEIARDRGFDIYGDRSFCIDRADGTIITSLNNEQEKVFNIGNNTVITKNWSLRNILFSSDDFKYNSNGYFVYDTNNIKQITGQVVNLFYATFGFTDNIFFSFINGRALRISSCWELYNGLFNFRRIDSLNKSIWCFDTADSTLTNTPNITACTFEKVMFEAIAGDLISVEKKCNLSHCHFGIINFEDYKLTNVYNYTTFSDENIPQFDENTAVHNGIFNFRGDGQIDVDSIELNNFSYWYFTLNNINYVHDTVIAYKDTNAFPKIAISNITVQGMNKDGKITYQPKELKPWYKEQILIGNIVLGGSEKKLIFDVYSAYNVQYNGEIKALGTNSFFANNLTPFYKNVTALEKTLGNLCYDESCINPLKLATRFYPSAATPYLGLLCLGSKMKCLVKIPEGKNITIAFSRVDNATIYTIRAKLEGTEEWQIAEFDYSTRKDIYYDGAKMKLAYVASESSVSYYDEVLLDCYWYE